MPNTLVYIIIVGLFIFLLLMVLIGKTILKLRKEELCHFSNEIQIEISEIYIPDEILTYKFKKHVSHTPTQKRQLQHAIPNRTEVFELINVY